MVTWEEKVKELKKKREEILKLQNVYDAADKIMKIMQEKQLDRIDIAIVDNSDDCCLRIDNEFFDIFKIEISTLKNLFNEAEIEMRCIGNGLDKDASEYVTYRILLEKEETEPT